MKISVMFTVTPDYVRTSSCLVIPAIFAVWMVKWWLYRSDSATKRRDRGVNLELVPA